MTEDLLQEAQPPVEALPLPPPTRYRLTVLTPTLAGDGQKLSPIDYMVWKDQVNVLNQRRIFRLLARGPRIESYLGQLRKSEKLDFASWGGYAQNYALRRIAFDDLRFESRWHLPPGQRAQGRDPARPARGPGLGKPNQVGRGES
jgi:hypothetical protein